MSGCFFTIGRFDFVRRMCCGGLGRACYCDSLSGERFELGSLGSVLEFNVLTDSLSIVAI